MSISEPSVKRTYAFVDGQNLFNAAKEAFGYGFPNYDVQKLAESVCRIQGWQLDRIHFYTGIPSKIDRRHAFWERKLLAMGRRGIVTFTRPIRYSVQRVTLPDGSTQWPLVGREKGIDVRIALESVRYALDGSYDVGLFFTQDQDLAEAVEEIKRISDHSGRWIKCACASGGTNDGKRPWDSWRQGNQDRPRAVRLLHRSD